MRKTVALLAGLLVLVLANITIYNREQLLTEGRVVLLQLAPVDPRSLMQGDYMALRFAVANDAFDSSNARENRPDGQIVLKLDERSIGTLARLDDGSALKDTEIRMRYRIRNGQAKFATNAFFFQEGDAKKYEAARYGEFRVTTDGEAILTNLRDNDANLLGEAERQ